MRCPPSPTESRRRGNRGTHFEKWATGVPGPPSRLEPGGGPLNDPGRQAARLIARLRFFFASPRIDLLRPATRVMNVVTATRGQGKSEMKTYTIDAENSITAHATKQDAGEGESFSSQQELASLVAEWPTDRLAEVWNGIPGLTPVKKFTDRKSAVARIWKAIQSLDGGSAAEAATAAPKRANKAKGAAKKGKKAKTAAKAPAKAAKGKPAKGGNKPAAARDGSKKATVLGLVQRKGGATLAQIMKATGWHAHSVRGFISGALGKKMGLTVDSVRREDGERVYSIG
jgi:hypothetical protein